jgi:hypothetical protein
MHSSHLFTAFGIGDILEYGIGDVTVAATPLNLVYHTSHSQVHRGLPRT